jgi:FtsH-binding integral membrane protein
MARGRKQVRGQSFSLAALFLLVALCAILTAQLSPLIREWARGSSASGTVAFRFDPGELVAWTISSFLLGMFYGGVIGAYHYRRARGVTWGIVTGLLLGLVAGPIAYASTRMPVHTLVTAVGGAFILVGVATMYRFVNDRDPSTRRKFSGTR